MGGGKKCVEKGKVHGKSAVPGKHVKAERARGKGLCGCRAVKPVGFYSRNQWAKADSERKCSNCVTAVEAEKASEHMAGLSIDCAGGEHMHAAAGWPSRDRGSGEAAGTWRDQVNHAGVPDVLRRP